MYKDNSLVQSNATSPYSISSVVAVYTVKAKNVYGQTTIDSNEVSVINPSFSINGGIIPNGKKTFRININTPTRNGNYQLSGSNLTTTGYNNSTTINTTTLNPGTYSFTVILTDQLGLTASANTSSISIANPYVNLSSFSLSATNNTYSFNISSAGGNGSYTIYVQIRESNGTVRVNVSYTNTGSKSGSYNFTHGITYDLYAYIQDSWDYSTSWNKYGNAKEDGTAPSGSITIGSLTWNGTNTFTLSSISSSVNAQPPASYQLYYNGTYVKDLGSSVSSTTHNVGSINAGTYSFYIRAYNTIGGINGSTKQITLTAPNLTLHRLTVASVSNIRIDINHEINLGGSFTVSVSSFQMNKNGTWLNYSAWHVGTLGNYYQGTSLINSLGKITYRGIVNIANGATSTKSLDVFLGDYFDSPSGVASITNVSYESSKLTFTIYKTQPATDGNKNGSTLTYTTSYLLVIKNSTGSIIETINTGSNVDGVLSIPVSQSAIYNNGGTFTLEAYRWNYVYFSTSFVSTTFTVVNFGSLNIAFDFGMKDEFLKNRLFLINLHSGNHSYSTVPSTTPKIISTYNIINEDYRGEYISVSADFQMYTTKAIFGVFNMNLNTHYLYLKNSGGYNEGGEFFWGISSSSLRSFITRMVNNNDITESSGNDLKLLDGSYSSYFNENFLIIKCNQGTISSVSGNTKARLDIPYLSIPRTLYDLTLSPIRLFGITNYWSSGVSVREIRGVYKQSGSSYEGSVSTHIVDDTTKIDNILVSGVSGYQSLFNTLQGKDNIQYFIEYVKDNIFYLYFIPNGQTTKYYLYLPSTNIPTFSSTNKSDVRIDEVLDYFTPIKEYQFYIITSTGERVYFYIFNARAIYYSSPSRDAGWYIMNSDGNIYPNPN